MFWHEYAKIPRHTSQNAITEGDFKCILARNCEGTEQLRKDTDCFFYAIKQEMEDNCKQNVTIQ